MICFVELKIYIRFNASILEDEIQIVLYNYCGNNVATTTDTSVWMAILFMKGCVIMFNVVNTLKDDVFQIRVNSEIKGELANIFSKNGLALTDAINVFFQQSLNTGGFSFSVTEDNAEKWKPRRSIDWWKN